MDGLSLKERLVEPLLSEISQRDVTIACKDGKQQKYHQCLLASYSPFLKSLVSERAGCVCKSASCGGMTDVMIILDGFSEEVLVNLMLYMYTGECKVKNRKMILDMIELKKVLGIEVEISFNVNKSPVVVGNNESEDISTRTGQKRITIAIMSAIEQVNSGVSKILCSECDQCLNKDNFMLHYRNHMQVFAQQPASETSKAENCKKSTVEVHEEFFAEDVAKHKNDHVHDEDVQVENFSDFLKNKFNSKSIKLEPMDTLAKQANLSERDLDDDAETVMQSHDDQEPGTNVMQSHGDQEPGTNIDMQEYEKLLRSSIHTLIVSRKRKKAKLNKNPGNELILVSQQEIDEEILKNPRNKVEEYGRLKVRQVYRKIYDKKQKLKSKDKSDKDPVFVTDEEIQDEIDKENASRSVKVNLNVKLIKMGRSRNNLSSTPNNFAVPATPVKRNNSRNLATPRKSKSSSQKSPPTSLIEESERKKVYHKLYVQKWKQNQEEGITVPIQISDEEILQEYLSNN